MDRAVECYKKCHLNARWLEAYEAADEADKPALITFRDDGRADAEAENWTAVETHINDFTEPASTPGLKADLLAILDDPRDYWPKGD